MTRSRLTRPGTQDLEWMSVVCTPESTHVEFHEDQDDALDAASSNLAPTVSTYVGHVVAQGEHRSLINRGTITLEFPVDKVMRSTIEHLMGTKLKTRRELKLALLSVMRVQLQKLRDEYIAAHGVVP